MQPPKNPKPAPERAPKAANSPERQRFLRAFSDLVNRYSNKNNTKHTEGQTQHGVVAWMACDDTALRCIDGGMHQPSLQGMVDPLPDPIEQQAQTEKQGVCVGNAFYLHREADNHPRCSKCNKEVVPVLDLEPSVRFISQKHSPNTLILAQGGAA